MKALWRGFIVVLTIVLLPALIGLSMTIAAGRLLNLPAVANRSFDATVLWGSAVLPDPILLFEWGLVGLVVGALTAEKTLARTVAVAIVAVAIVAPVTFAIMHAFGYQIRVDLP